jgi:hypothetical protein
MEKIGQTGLDIQFHREISLEKVDIAKQMRLGLFAA